ncbi:MAG: DNA-3-methyladenine glycosylase I [Candidatus Eremiobacteraeota bacterium]|nr:DNA-3-methyladenine glycosylase I [Candidatus Eremiobacteraeota bacterium]MBC5804128.1 DNA-3-methyladenine glycosylase I [Candidatus Eremiobacteraeota bacterium]MBC5821819.1 DNA-3-methyladenine glycosylase I [Candidatus Eremiobacteraeota bacterium]
MAIPERMDSPRLCDYLAVMSRAVFQAGLSWTLIESKWDAYVRLFEGFDVERVAAFDEVDVDRILADGGIVRTRKKVVATIANARTLLTLDRECGGFARYLASFSDYGALADDLRERFAFLGPISVYYFVFLCGGRVPRFEDWEKAVRGDHPRMREMIAHARAQGWDG